MLYALANVTICVKITVLVNEQRQIERLCVPRLLHSVSLLNLTQPTVKLHVIVATAHRELCSTGSIPIVHFNAATLSKQHISPRSNSKLGCRPQTGTIHDFNSESNVRTQVLYCTQAYSAYNNKSHLETCSENDWDDLQGNSVTGS